MTASESKRVAFVVSRFSPFVGGAENYSLNVAQGIGRSGFDATVLTVVPPIVAFGGVWTADLRSCDSGARPLSYPICLYGLPHVSFQISNVGLYDQAIVNGYHNLLSMETVTLSFARIVFVSHFHGFVGRNELGTRYTGTASPLGV